MSARRRALARLVRVGVETVDLVQWDPAWPARFAKARAELRRALGDAAVSIEHIGSTAVPGLIAKPTIDIAVGVRSIPEIERRRSELEAPGYEWRGQRHRRHRFLRRIDETSSERTEHLHVVEVPSDELDAWLLFRDHLRANPAAAAVYADRKRELAQRFPNDRDAYARAKTDVIEWLLAVARSTR